MYMPFGKHRGQPLSDIPDGYLQWLLSKCECAETDLKHAAKMELLRRQIDRMSQEATLRGAVHAISEDIADRWYRLMSIEYHPDKGGSHQQMLVVQRGRELLRSLTPKRGN